MAHGAKEPCLGVKVEDISAEIANGVLKVTVPKAKAAQARRIEIK